MPDFIGDALNQHNLMAAYRARPDYQQNDYIGWIMQAKRPETRTKRLNQMIDELRGGTKYMNMAYNGPA